MSQPTKWYIKYEQMFLNNDLNVSQAIYEDLGISASSISPWPDIKQLPQLIKSYQLLENYILSDKNWTSNLCGQVQIQIIQYQLNLLATKIQCEKQYGRLFWHKNRRTIQASIIHFYIYFARLISAIIPVDCQNVFTANSQEKLITDIIRLQELVNKVIYFIKPLYQFMFSPQFIEEQKLTQQFFEKFNFLLKNLPKIKRKFLEEIPKLMEYVIVCNSIDDQLSQISSNSKKSEEEVRKQKDKKHQRPNNFIKTDKKEDGSSLSMKKYQFVVFGERIRKNSIFNKKKKFTVTTKENQSKEKSLSFQRSRSISPSINRSSTIQGKQQRKTLKRQLQGSEIADESVIDGRNRNISNMTSMTQQSQRNRQISIFNRLNYEEEIPEMQRGQRTKKKKKKIQVPLKITMATNQINIQHGKSRGWGILRQYLQKKIAQRKIKKLLNFF